MVFVPLSTVRFVLEILSYNTEDPKYHFFVPIDRQNVFLIVR